MSFEKLLLDKYPIIEKVAMDRSLLVLDVTNLTSFNEILERCGINYKESSHDGVVSHHKFGVYTVPAWPGMTTKSKVFIPRDSVESVIKNLLL